METDQEGACQQHDPAEQDGKYRARPENERPLEGRDTGCMGWESGFEGRHRGISFLTTSQFLLAKTMPDGAGARAIQTSRQYDEATGGEVAQPANLLARSVIGGLSTRKDIFAPVGDVMYTHTPPPQGWA